MSSLFFCPPLGEVGVNPLPEHTVIERETHLQHGKNCCESQRNQNSPQPIWKTEQQRTH